MEILEMGPFLTEREEAESVLAPPWRLRQLMDAPDPLVRFAVGEHPRCPADVLRQLGHDSEWLVVSVVAGNIRTPPDVLIRLAEDTAVVVREFVAANISTPTSALEALAHDPCEEVRVAVASNPTTPVKPQEGRRAGRGWMVWGAVASRARGPEDEAPQHAADPDLGAAWDATLGVHGRELEAVAWAVACSGFVGTLAELALIAAGTLVP